MDRSELGYVRLQHCMTQLVVVCNHAPMSEYIRGSHNHHFHMNGILPDWHHHMTHASFQLDNNIFRME